MSDNSAAMFAWIFGKRWKMQPLQTATFHKMSSALRLVILCHLSTILCLIHSGLEVIYHTRLFADSRLEVCDLFE